MSKEKTFEERVMENITTTKTTNGVLHGYDSNKNPIYYKDRDGYEYWREYDKNNNIIHYKNSQKFEYWQEYDSNGNIIHFKNLDGIEYWKEYDENCICIHCKYTSGIEYFYGLYGEEITKEEYNKLYNKGE